MDRTKRQKNPHRGLQRTENGVGNDQSHERSGSSFASVAPGQDLLMINDITGCYAIPGFIDAAKKVEKEVLSRYKLKWSILGVTGPKTILLKGFNMVSKIKLAPFNTREQAIAYLCNDSER